MVLPLIAGYGAGLGLKAADELFMEPVKRGIDWFYGDKHKNRGQAQQGAAMGAATSTPMDPASHGQMALAAALSRNAMAQGTSTAPVAGPWGALARALQGTIGGYMGSHLGDDGMGAPGQAMGGQQFAAAAQSPQLQTMGMGTPGQAKGRTVGAMFPEEGMSQLQLRGARNENAAAENAMYATPGQAKGRTVGAMFPNGPEDLTQVQSNRAQGENAANEHGFIVLGPAPGGGYRVQDPKTGKTGTWQP